MKTWIKAFKWESPDQEKGFLSFAKWLRDLPERALSESLIPERGPFATKALLNCVVAFFIQKDHESHEWWAETVADQVKRLEEQIRHQQTWTIALETRVKFLEREREKRGLG